MFALIFMGVSGCGKSTYARQFSQALLIDYIEGDDLHDKAAIAKMTAGIPLSDEDRWPWLDRLAVAISIGDKPVIATCSALKKSYRDRLRSRLDCRLGFAYLDVPRLEIERRLAKRQGHFMPENLLSSQFELLELAAEEADIITISHDDIEWQNRVHAWLKETLNCDHPFPRHRSEQ